MKRTTESRLRMAERLTSERREATPLNLDALSPEARADFLAHYSEGVGDYAAMQSATLLELKKQAPRPAGA